MQMLGRDMQALRKEAGYARKITFGERTLGQHIDGLLEVIRSLEDVKNLMQKIS